jgi:DNA-binding response OmpR family regulator
MTENILVIDDDEKLLKLITLALEAKGYSVFTATNGEEGETLFHQNAPNLVILDVMMPGLKGWEVCHRIRQVSSVPIIFLTALGQTEHLVHGLQTGADDYVAKPVKIAELTARVTALLRRARMPHEQPEVLRFRNGTLIINRTEQKVFARGLEVSLSPTEYNLLLFMVERAGRILPAELLFDAIWGVRSETRLESVKWHIWRLRQKIEADPQNPQFILTERGKGYRFSPQ